MATKHPDTPLGPKGPPVRRLFLGPGPPAEIFGPVPLPSTTSGCMRMLKRVAPSWGGAGIFRSSEGASGNASGRHASASQERNTDDPPSALSPASPRPLWRKPDLPRPIQGLEFREQPNALCPGNKKRVLRYIKLYSYSRPKG